VSAMLDGEVSFQRFFDDLQQFEEGEQAECAEREGAGDVLSGAERSVASDGRTEAAMPIADTLSVWGGGTAALQFSSFVRMLQKAV
jgi:hypothetical protein